MTLPARRTTNPPQPPPGPPAGLVCLVGFLVALTAALYQIAIGHTFGGAYPWWAPLLVGAAGAGGFTLLGQNTTTHTKVTIYRAGTWLVASTWTTVAGLLSNHLGWMMIAWLVLTVFCVAAAPAFAVHPALVQPVQPVEVLEGEIVRQEPTDLATRLRNAIITVTKPHPSEVPDVRIIEHWEPYDAGATLLVSARHGTQFGLDQMVSIQRACAEVMRLPDGCSVEARPAGTNQAETKVSVSTRNYLLEPFLYPHDFSELDVREPFSVGRFADRSLTMAEVYQSAGVVLSQRGNGKTTFLHNMTISLGRCRNALVWHIDLNNGGMSNIWLQQFAKGQVKYPVVDWAASDIDEAIIMAMVAKRIMLYRKKLFAGVMTATNSERLQVEPDMPEIVIIVDEAAQVVGGKGGKKEQLLTSLLTDIQQMGRAVCVNLFLSVLRATGDYMPADLKKGTALALAGKVKDDSELAQLFGWEAKLNHKLIVAKGMMFIEALEQPPRLMKAWYVPPKLIHEATLALQDIRAMVGFNALEVKIAGPAYRDRWNRPGTQATLRILAAGKNLDLLMEAVDEESIEFDEEEFLNGGDGGGKAPAKTGGGGGGGKKPSKIAPVVDMDDWRAQIDLAKQQFADSQQAKPSEPDTPQEPAAQAAQPATPQTQTQTTTPTGNLTDAEVDAYLAALEALPTTTEPGAAVQDVDDQMPVLDEPGTRAERQQERYRFILGLLRAAGDKGMETKDLNHQVKAAGYSSRDNGASTDLSRMAGLGLVTQIPPGGDEVKYGWWWAA